MKKNKFVMQKNKRTFYQFRLHKKVFSALFHLIEEQTRASLLEKELIKDDFSLEKMPFYKKIGFNQYAPSHYKCSINYVILRFLQKEANEQPDAKKDNDQENLKNYLKEHYHLDRNYDLRHLYSMHKINSSLGREENDFLFDIRYFALYLDFLNISYESLLGRLSDNKVFNKQYQNLSNTNISVFKKDKEAKQNDKGVYYFWYYYLTYEPDKVDARLKNPTLQYARAVFEDLPKKQEATSTFRLSKLTNSQVFEGTLTVFKETFAVINAHSIEQRREQASRPLAITMSSTTTTPFSKVKVFVGTSTRINEGGKSINGLVVFEQTENFRHQRKLDAHKVLTYLSNPLKKIAIDKVVDVDEFNEKIAESYPNYEEIKQIQKSLLGKFYETYLIYKNNFKSSVELPVERYIEKAIIYISKSGQVRCQNIATNNGLRAFYGKITKITTDRVFIEFSDTKNGTYQIVLELSNHRDDYIEMRGIYGGVNQSGKTSAGRCILIEVAHPETASLEDLEPTKIQITDDQFYELLKNKKYTELKNFFAGEKDQFIDRNDFFLPMQLFNKHHTKSVEQFAGNYYIYRTRTNAPYNTHTKRIPLYIERNGGLKMNFSKNLTAKENEKSNETIGQVFSIKNRLYLRFNKPEDYEGQAIFYLSTAVKSDYLSGFYCSVEKHGHLIAGQCYLIKLDEENEPITPTIFDNAKVEYLKKEDDQFISDTEKEIVHALSGRLDNFMIRKNANSIFEEDYGRIFLEAACFATAIEKDYERASKLIKMALWDGGFRDSKAIEEKIINAAPHKALRELWKYLDISENAHSTDEENEKIKTIKSYFKHWEKQFLFIFPID